MNTAGLIFSNIHDGSIPELTGRRTMASVPFGCRYRLIDFTLSNMVNSGITNVGIITHYNYQSLLDHIGMGTDWDLARRSGGIKILPPYIAAYQTEGASRLYTTRLEALMGALSFIARAKEDTVVLSDCDVICNMDLSDMIRHHETSGNDITLAIRRVNPREHRLTRDVRVIRSDEAGNLQGVDPYEVTDCPLDVSMNVFVIRRTLLYTLVTDACARGYSYFYKDILLRNLGALKIGVYRYQGYYSLISSLAGYFECSMKLLETSARTALFEVPGRPVYTKIRNSPPTKYYDTARVSGSILADGCVIEGCVENSILFRGVKVGRGSVVRNCILLQDTCVGDNVKINCVITDKNAVIKDYRNLSGHPSLPYFIDKGLTV